MYNICLYFIMFLCYSIFGWVIECISCSFNQKRFVHDRGFLIGPYCPIYGYGAMYMYFFLNGYASDPIVLFVMGVVGTSALEYFTSYMMEKLFKARWWDYSNAHFNINGRVCLRNSIAFGILGMAFVYILNPSFMSVLKQIPQTLLIIISVICFIIFVIDNILSFSIMSKLKKNLTNIRRDSTSDIDKEVKSMLSSHKFYWRRLFNSFPKVKISLPSGEAITNSIRKTLDSFDALRKERKKRKKELKKELKKQKESNKGSMSSSVGRVKN